MATQATQNLSFGGDPSKGVAPTTYNTTTGQQTATATNAGQFNGLQMPTGDAAKSTFNPTTGQQTTPATPPIASSATPPPVSTLPTLANGATAGSNLTNTPTGLQMPAGAAGSTVFDPTTGKQVSPSEAAFNATKASGQKPPQDSATGLGTAADTTKSATPPSGPNVNLVNTTLANDPTYQKLVADINAAKSTATNSETLTQQYQDLLTQYNIPGINTELLNDQKIINGTEDDIRSEVQAAGGFATDSQVLGLATARNKTLIQNYNNLVAQKTDLMSQINTISGLEDKDRTYAQTQADNTLQLDSQLADYAQKFQTNAQQAYQNVISAVGYAGLYKALQADPSSVSLAEQTLGLSPGSLASIAAIPDPDAQLKALQLAQAQTNLQQSQAEEPLKVKQLQAQINSSNASAASSATSTAINKQNLDFMTAHGGLNQAEYAASQKPIQDQATVQQNTNDLQTYLTNQAGQDGYVSPDTWAKALSAWQADFAGTGITAPSFTDVFGQYANPKITTQYTTGTTLGKK